MSRILKESDQQAIGVLSAKVSSQRWISRELGDNRRTIARCASKRTTPKDKVTAG
jgi:IS30 family transposase